MPKDIDASYIPNFYRKGISVYTGYQMDLADNGLYETRFIANNEDIGGYTALAIKRGTITSEDGTILNELEISLDNTDLEFRQWVLSGYLERKLVRIVLLFGLPGGTIGSTVIIYWGMMDAPKGDESWVSITIKPLRLLDREFPRRIFQFGCNWQFGGYPSPCGIQLYNHRYDGTLSSTSDGTTLAIGHGQADGYYVPGYVEILDGDYAGEVRPIGSNTSGGVVTRVSFGHTIDAGTGVRVQRVCAKNPVACTDNFDNYSQYGGFPTVPRQPII